MGIFQFGGQFVFAVLEALLVAVDHDERDDVRVVRFRAPSIDEPDEIIEDVTRRRATCSRRGVDTSLSVSDSVASSQSLHKVLVQFILAKYA